MKTFNRTLAIGDIHGGYRAMMQCFERAKFDYKKDRLIVLGDVADGWSEVVECIEELHKIKNLVYIIGNHDLWLMRWLEYGDTPPIWTTQGGRASINSYTKQGKKMDKTIQRHLEFFNKGVYYFIDEQNRLFVHGGFNWHFPVEKTNNYDLTWDRHLWETAGYWNKVKKNEGLFIKQYKEVFIGHTTTSWYDNTLKPVNFTNVWNLDQGGGWEGKLTIMDVESKEFWQSDIVKTLYPDEKGR